MIQECALANCCKLSKAYLCKIWIEYIKPNPEIYIIGLVIILISWGIGGGTVAAQALIAVATAMFAIHVFYAQQRTARIQKIYYEEFLLDFLKHVDEAINIAAQNSSFFTTAINFINNDIKRSGIVSETTIKGLDSLLSQVQNTSLYFSSKKEVLITLFGKKGYIIHQWLFKCEHDIINFNSFFLEILTGYRAIPPSNKKEIDDQLKELSNNFELILRHTSLTYFLNKIVQRIGMLDFKSREQIINFIANDLSINDTLEKINESFKVLFGWFKLEDKVFISYLKNEGGNHYKLFLEQIPRLEECSEHLPTTEMKIVFEDTLLSNVSIKVGGAERLYSKIQIGMANMVAFDEKPQFYPEVRSFCEFK